MKRTDTDAINTLAEKLRVLLETRRDYFVIDELTLYGGSELVGTEPGGETQTQSRTVSAASLRLVHDWCTNDWPMDLEDFLCGMFHGCEWDKRTPAYQLIPEAASRLTADSLGLGHLYPPKETPP